MPKAVKTNVTRLLQAQGVVHAIHTYDTGDGAIDGVSVAQKVGADPARVFKTLVAVGRSGGHYVFVIPVAATLDLKRAAAAAKEKNMHMLPQKELLPLTGYIHGGCSPIGMKKPFPTFLDTTAETLDELYVSAGKVGVQVSLQVPALQRLTGAVFAPLTEE